MKKPILKKERKFSFSPVEPIIIGLIIGTAALVYFQRLWFLRFFTYDQARDALYVKRILDGQLRLIGTQSSIPGLYTAPLYYYLMVPFLFLFDLNPVGIDFAVGLGAILAIGLVYWLLRRNAKMIPAVFLTFLFAFSPSLVHQARFGWNPNLLPLTTMLFLIGSDLVFIGKQPRFFWLIGASLGAAINFHYSGLGLLAGFIVLCFLFRPNLRKYRKEIAAGVLIFAFLLAPLLLFDLRHQGTNLRNILRYLSRGTGGEIPPPPFWAGLWEKHTSLVELVFPFGSHALFAAGWLLTIGGMFFIEVRDRKKTLLSLGFVLYVTGLFFASLYRGSFFPFYLTFLYPLPFILTGLAFSHLKGLGRIIWFVLVIVAVGLVSVSKQNILPEDWRNGRYAQLDLVGFSFSTRLRPEEKFNLVALYRQPDRFDYNAVDYRYFLEAGYGISVPGWEAADYQEAESLYLISEAGPVDPLRLKAWEVQSFGPKKIVGYWTVGEETVIYKLTR